MDSREAFEKWYKSERFLSADYIMYRDSHNQYINDDERHHHQTWQAATAYQRNETIEECETALIGLFIRSDKLYTLKDGINAIRALKTNDKEG